ncbi:MAG: SUMF1/EgtB/PvdO family nonheme iron enzyme [Spirochaetales bacterium]|nr:SUMF1/EgtB/PvdO family nonheme iron enzyme [Spirochaetales bacterium]
MIKKTVLNLLLFIFFLLLSCEGAYDKQIHNVTISVDVSGSLTTYIADIYEIAPSRYGLDPRIGAIVFKVNPDAVLSSVSIKPEDSSVSGSPVTLVNNSESLSLGSKIDDYSVPINFTGCVYDYETESIATKQFFRIFSGTGNFKDYIVVFETTSSVVINEGSSVNKLVNVPGGSYQIGGTSVSYDEFYLSSHEITNIELFNVYNWGLENGFLYFTNDGALYSVLDSNKLLIDFSSSNTPLYADYAEEDGYKKYFLRLLSGYNDYPAVGVTYFGAMTFCWLLNIKNGLEQPFSFSSEVYDLTKNGYRLPTEKEWEGAARYNGTDFNVSSFVSGASSAGQEDEYSWNSSNYSNFADRPSALANYRLVIVGQKKSNSLGIYDMSGNVFEWVADSYSFDYGGGAGILTNNNEAKVIKGGSCYMEDLIYLQPGQRMSFNKTAFSADVGFRVARSSINYK